VRVLYGLWGGGELRIVANAQIRPARAADVPSIQRIYAHHVLTGKATFEIEPPDLAEMIRRFESLSGGDYPYLVGERDGVILGYAYAGPYRPRPAYRFTVEDSIYLDPGGVG
jgi:L-amino acid N-acyltransferase YncA